MKSCGTPQKTKPPGIKLPDQKLHGAKAQPYLGAKKKFR